MLESQKKANRKWLAENYETLSIRVPKGTKEEIKEAAAVQGPLVHFLTATVR